jgi:tetratricopeptide (TPR) repeat protein
MALFVGGCTLEAVTAICNLEQSQDLTLLDGVQALLDKSLLKQTISTSGEPRFGMLETIRQFALKQLASSDEHQLVAPRHAEYYLTLAEQAESKLLGAESIAWLDQLETEYGNIRAALEWFKSRPSLAEAGARLAAALCPFWDMQGHFTEGRAWINTMLADSQKLPATILAKALDGAGVLARHQGDYVQAQQMHTQSLAIGPAVTAIARSHLNLGLVAYSMGSTLTAKQHLDTALAILEPEHAAPAEGGELLTQTLSALGKVAREQSDFEQARRYFQEALTLSRKLGNRRNEGQILNNLGGIENHLRHYPEARVHLIAALAIWRTLKDLPSEARTLHNLAVTEQETYHYADAQQHFAAALKVHETTGNRREQINTKIGLGILHYQIGKTDEALLWLQQALALSEEIGADARRPYVLANLGPVLRDLDDLAQAQHWLEEGLALAQIHNDKATQSYCLSHLGMVHLAAGRAAEAINAAYSALLLRRAIGFHAWTSTDLATLAAAHMALTHKEQARAYADESVQLLQEQRTHELELPQRDYFTCYQVYTALGQTERACSSLAVAHALVLSRAANISDPLLKRSFLEGVAINQAIMREAHQVFSSTEHSKHL